MSMSKKNTAESFKQFPRKRPDKSRDSRMNEYWYSYISDSYDNSSKWAYFQF